MFLYWQVGLDVLLMSFITFLYRQAEEEPSCREPINLHLHHFVWKMSTLYGNSINKFFIFKFSDGWVINLWEVESSKSSLFDCQWTWNLQNTLDQRWHWYERRQIMNALWLFFCNFIIIEYQKLSLKIVTEIDEI